MDSFIAAVDSVCVKFTYCPTQAELHEAACVSVIAVALFVTCSYEILSRRGLVANQHSLRPLRDDPFDSTLLIIYGTLLLVFAGISTTYEQDTLQVDVLVYVIVLGIVAIKLRDSITSGILFTTLSYSSWYGIYRLFLTVPVAENINVLLSPQWVAALIAFTGPALIANLKYPALMQSSMALVVYGSVLLSALIACNALFVFIDLALLYYDVLPNYASRIVSGANGRLYGRQLSIIERVGYYAAMVVLQLICVRIPHFMLDEHSLREQLAEANEQHQRNRPQPKPGAAKRERTNGVRSADIGAGKQDTEVASGVAPGMEGRVDMPEDCVEVTAEEAIRLQERGFKRAAMSTAPRTADNTKPADGSDGCGVDEEGAGVRRRKS
jgi:hypothetical protein